MTKIFNTIFSTDIFPVAGGATGAVLAPYKSMFPTFEAIIYTIVIATIGAVVGYMVKLGLDWVIKQLKK